jgi:prepilin-type N-terminal cleavage/methylation domain-containing protein
MMINQTRIDWKAARTSYPCENTTRAGFPCQWTRRRGFTLVELLVVITIILLISAVALPTVLPALSHRQVSEGARILQGALVGARDSAIKSNAFSGIRLLPDPTINGIGPPNLPNGQPNPFAGRFDPNQPFASNRIIPIAAAPDYSEGLVSLYYSIFISTNNYLGYPYSSIALAGAVNVPCLVVEESVIGPGNLPNEPTSWFWNIRVGDKIQFNNAGNWYTVIGPMVIYPTNPLTPGQNPELFVNVGQPGTPSALSHVAGINPEYLLLVNGQDDNNNGWIDEGFDGVDNDHNQVTDEAAEWEVETWQGAMPNELLTAPHGVLPNLQYVIQRRPAPTGNAREVLLPTNVVIDLSTWGFPNLTSPSQERSRLPVNEYTGYVDIVVYPNGSVVPTTIYSTPSSVSMSGSFLHFWLAERSDVYPPFPNPPHNNSSPPYLPLPQGHAPNLFNGEAIKGEYRLVTLFTKTGQILTNDTVPFDNPAAPANGTYNANHPFIQAQQGVRGGQ